MSTKDADGFLLTYWPITGLIEGQNSEVLTFSTPTPKNGYLRSTDDARANVWARRKGVGASYVNIGITGIDLSGMPAGDTQFEVYVEAVSPIEGLEVVPLYVFPSSADPAGWDV